VLNTVANILLIEWSLSKLKPLRPKSQKDRERDQKYLPFRRNDLDRLNRLVLYLNSPFTFLKFVSGWVGVMLCSVVVYLVSLTKAADKPFDMSSWQYWCVR